MDREKALGFFLNLIQQKFNSNPNEAVVQTQLAKIANHKVESNGLNRMGAMEQFKIQFDPATFTLSKTAPAIQAKFPELTSHWNENTITFINTLGQNIKQLKLDKLKAEQDLNGANERIGKLNAELAQKYAANKDALSAKIASLESTLADLTKTNALQATNIRDMLAKNQTLIKQMSGNEDTIKKLSEEVTQKNSMNAELKSEIDSQNADVNAKFEEYRRLLDENKKQMEEMSDKLSAQFLANSIKERELETKKSVENDNHVLKDTLSEKESALDKMRDEIANSSKDIETQYRMEKMKMQIVFDAQKSLMEKQQEYKIAQMTEEITKNSSSSNADLVKQIQELKAALAEALKATQQYEEEKGAFDREKQQCEEEKDDLEEENKRCKEEKIILDQEKQQCESEKNALKQTIEQNNNKILEIEKEIASLTFEQTRLKHAKDEQKQNIEKKRFNLEGEILKLKEEMEQLQIENNELYKRLDELQDELGTLKETYEKATQDLKTAHETEREKLILKQTEEIAKSAEKEKQVNMKYEIDACLINNSIASLGWNNWENAKTYFLDRYVNVDEIEGLKEITGLQFQIDAISKSGTLDDLIQSFGMLKPMFTSSSSSISSVEPDCMKNLVDLIIKFLRSQKEIEDLKKETENTRVEAEKIRTEAESAKQQHEIMVQQNDEIVLKLTALEDKIQATQGQNMDLSAEKAELQQQINDLQKQMIEQNNVLSADQKEEMKALLETVNIANVTIDQLKSELDQIKDELESSEYHKILSIGTNELLQNKKQELEADLKTHLSEIQKLKLEMDTLTETAEQQSTENHRAKIVNLTLAHELTKAANDNKELTQKLDSEKTRYEEMVNEAVKEIGDMEKEVNKLKNDFENSQAKLEAKQREFNKTQTTLESTQNDLEATQSVLESTQGELAATQSVLEKTKSDLSAKQRELDSKKQVLTETQGNLRQIENQLSLLTLEHAEIKKQLEALKGVIQKQKQEHDRAIQRAKDEYEREKAQINAQKTSAETDLQKLIAEKAQLEAQLKAATDANSKCESDLTAIQQAKDVLINKLSAIYKQQIIDRANYTLNRMNYKPTPTTPIKTISLNKSNRAGQDLIDMFGGSGLTMKGGTIINFSYDDEDDPSQKIDINNIKFLTNAEITEIKNKIQTLKDEIAALKSKPVTSSPNLKLLIQKLLITKAAHAQNYKDLLFEKIANGVNKQIIGVQMPAIEKLKTANEDLDAVNKVLNEEREDLETKCADLETANKDLETKNSKLEKDLVDAKNTATVSSGTTAAITAAKTSLGSGSSSSSSSSNSSMFMDKNVIYYKTSPPIATA
jgi:chromosome segregation ATPase